MINPVQRIIWKKIPGYEGYEINQLGYIRSIDRLVEYKDGRIRKFEGKIKTLNINPVNGYLQTCLSDHHKNITVYPHKLVAKVFVEKPISNEKLIVNHKSGNKTCNLYTNLEWVSYSENSKHSYNELKQKRPKSSGLPTAIIAYNDNECIEFKSIKEASRILGISVSQIIRLIESGKISKNYGYYFKKV